MAPRTADHGHAEHARRAARQGDGVAADEREAVALASSRNTVQESLLPGSGAGNRQAHQAPAGVAPFAARSDRFTAISFQPTLAGGSCGKEKDALGNTVAT